MGTGRARSDDGLRCDPIAAEASENEHSGFSSDLRKLTEVSHRRAAAVTDSSSRLIRPAHSESIISQRDRHRCTKTANQHQKCNRVFRQMNAYRTRGAVMSGYCRSMRAAIPYLLAITLIGFAFWMAVAAPLQHAN
jgi:hypothetical protein